MLEAVKRLLARDLRYGDVLSRYVVRVAEADVHQPAFFSFDGATPAAPRLS